MSAQHGQVHSDPAATQARIDLLSDYFSRELLGPGEMICSNRQDCRTSALATRGVPRRDVSFAEAQLPHVGHHFDLIEDGRPLRILIVGMEMGEPVEHVSIAQRRDQILVSAALPMTHRNPHMQGVMNALRLGLGRKPGADRAGELIDLDPPVHLFDACATSNVRLCSAFTHGRKSRSTPLMTQRCLRHLAATIEILKPTIVVAQGEVGKALWPIVDGREDAGPHLSRIVVRGVPAVLARFAHPSAWGAQRWGGLDFPCLRDTVAPVMAAARRAAR